MGVSSISAMAETSQAADCRYWIRMSESSGIVSGVSSMKKGDMLEAKDTPSIQYRYHARPGTKFGLVASGGLY